MGDYVPIISEFFIFSAYFVILCLIMIILYLSKVVKKENHGEAWKWGSITCAVLGCLTTWGMVAIS